jgi:hypothetical protein
MKFLLLTYPYLFALWCGRLGSNLQPPAWAIFNIRIITFRVLAIMPVISLLPNRPNLFLLDIDRWGYRHDYCRRMAIIRSTEKWIRVAIRTISIETGAIKTRTIKTGIISAAYTDT